MGVVLFFVWIGLSFLVGYAASERGRSGIAWGALSLLTSPLIGFIALIAAGDAS
jgi:hypothetical protein